MSVYRTIGPLVIVSKAFSSQECVQIVNNHPVTKNELGSFQFIFGHRVVIHFIMQQKSTKIAKKLTRCQEICFPQFSAITQQKVSSKFATIAVHFVDNLYFSCPLFHLTFA